MNSYSDTATKGCKLLKPENQTKLSDKLVKVTVNFANKSTTHCCVSKVTELYYGLLTPDQAPAYQEGQLLLVQGNSDSGLVPRHCDSSTCGEKNVKVRNNFRYILWRNMDSYTMRLKIFQMVMSILSKWFERSFIL